MESKAKINQSFETLFREFFRPLTIFAIQYVKDQDIAEDIVQDLFLNLYEKKESLKIQVSVHNYLYTSVLNRCLKYLEYKRVRVEHNPDVQNSLNSKQVDPLELVSLFEFENKYVQVLESLSPKCREVFEMSRMDGKKNNEIAEELKISKRTVETHISNALRILRKRLKKYIKQL
ncbi:MAG: RNA polymerase sigma-70 factor [Bacteroidales bacterium]|nr:MAG: RNA polymerase sigma-70 factor [Bacteroidales bacterium]